MWTGKAGIRCFCDIAYLCMGKPAVLHQVSHAAGEEGGIMLCGKYVVRKGIGIVLAVMTMVQVVVSAGGIAKAAQDDGYADTSGYEHLYELYEDYFKLGAACEAISHWNDKGKEIGNPAKEELLETVFNSITCGNELKPAYLFDPESESLVSVTPAAKEMLDWAVQHDMGMRGHTLVWHSQVNPAIFAKDYQAYSDGKLTSSDTAELDEACLVDRDTLLSRMRTYIYGVMEYTYKNGYAGNIYAWDVVNEAADERNEDGLRRSYWYRIIGPDYLYYAFLYAREAETLYAEQYAAEYGLDARTDDLSGIMPKLFYNDYNEWFDERSDKIVNFLTQEQWNKDHAAVSSAVIADDGDGTIYGDGLLDGIGMQGHLDDTQDIDQYMRALEKYNAVVDEVQITELDVGISRTDDTAWYYQAEFYYDFFSRLVGAVKNGVNLTSVTVWGLTDDASWRVDANPLLFFGNLEKKPAFDALVMAAKGEAFDMTVAETLPEAGNLLIDFEPYAEAGNMKTVVPKEVGIIGRGTGHQAVLTLEPKVNHTDGAAIGYSLKVSRKEQDAGMKLDVSRYAGKLVTVIAHVMTEDQKIRMGLDTGSDTVIAETDSTGDWTVLAAECAIPQDIKAAYIYIETDGAADFYADDISVTCGVDRGTGTVSEEVTAVRDDVGKTGIGETAEESAGIAETADNRQRVSGAVAAVVIAAAVIIVTGLLFFTKRK